jgi:hypothetical protein
VRTYKVSRDPQFVARVNEGVGLYLNPPDLAVVLSLHEKTSIQALQRTQLPMPLRSGRLEHAAFSTGTPSVRGSTCATLAMVDAALRPVARERLLSHEAAASWNRGLEAAHLFSYSSSP